MMAYLEEHPDEEVDENQLAAF